MDYEQHYRLQESLSSDDTKLIPAPELFTYSEEEMYAAEMDRLSLDLPDGSPSPFRSKSPGSAHAILVSAMVHQMAILGHEVNLIPDRAWVHFLRLLGAEIQPAESPILNVRFTKSPDYYNLGESISVPIGTVISNADNTIQAYTQFSRTFTSELEVIIPARVATVGNLSNYRLGSLSRLITPILGIDSVRDVEIVSLGKNEGDLPSVVAQARNGMRVGSMGKAIGLAVLDANDDYFLTRCITARDYVYCANRLGSAKSNVLQGQKRGAIGYFGDLTTLIVYPEGVVESVDRSIRPMMTAGTRLETIPADVIPIDGTISIRKDPSLLATDARNAIATIIVDKFNPPYGKWQPVNFVTELAVEIEKIPGIYAVPQVLLKHAITNAPLSAIALEPWHLIEIQSSLEIQSI